MRSAIVLAGGTSKRFGADKGLLEIRGKPMISYVIDACVAASIDDVLVVVSTGEQREKLLRVFPRGARVVMDDKERYHISGPLLGMVTGLEHAKARRSFVTGCDTPLVRAELIDYIFTRAVKGVDAVVPRWPNGYIEPLQAIYTVGSTLRAARIVVDQGRRDLRSLMSKLKRVDYVSTDELRRIDPKLVSFLNVNEASDLNKLEGIIEEIS